MYVLEIIKLQFDKNVIYCFVGPLYFSIFLELFFLNYL